MNETIDKKVKSTYQDEFVNSNIEGQLPISLIEQLKIPDPRYSRNVTISKNSLYPIGNEENRNYDKNKNQKYSSFMMLI